MENDWKPQRKRSDTKRHNENGKTQTNRLESKKNESETNLSRNQIENDTKTKLIKKKN